MSIRHLRDLQSALENGRWEIESRECGDDFRFSAIWIVSSRRFPGFRARILFDGFDDMTVLPIEKSYGCRIDINLETPIRDWRTHSGKTTIPTAGNHPEGSIYFSRSKAQWQKDLSSFTDALEWLAKAGTKQAV